MNRARGPQAALLAIPFGVAGFALAGTLLAAGAQPVAWTPVVDPEAGASVTEIGDPDRESPVSGVVYTYEFPSRPSWPARDSEPSSSAPLPPRIEGELGIPQIVLDAYRSAEATLAEADASCHLTWQMLAGVGRVESAHARNGLVYADGTTFEPILGPVLDGSGGYAAIRDTDDGVLDGDPVWDRAVGPMQFIPGTWSAVGVDGNDDGRVDPHNVFDAALAAGRYLCAGSADLADRAGLERALFRYNHSAAYVALVLAWIDGYTAGQVIPLPPQTPPPPPSTTEPTTPPPTSPPPTSPPPTSPPTTSPAVGPTTNPPTTTTPPTR